MLESVELENATALALGFGTLATAMLIVSFLAFRPGSRAHDAPQAAVRVSTPRALPPELLSL